MAKITSDANDILIWKLNETSGPFRNSGSLYSNNTLTDLNITNTITQIYNEADDGYCAGFPGTHMWPVGASSTRNYAAGAKTINISPPITVSAWVYLRQYNLNNNTTLIGKEYRDSTLTSGWSIPYLALDITTLTSNNGQDWRAQIATSSSTVATFTVTDFPIPRHQWAHIGFTYNGTVLKAYINGCQCIYYSGSNQLNYISASTLSYTDGVNGYGFWKIGATTAAGSANKEEANYNIRDIRVANVARPLSYFQSAYKIGALGYSNSTLTQYYKLRSFDTSCVTPTAVTWVDTSISLTNAPPFPCSGPYTAPEVLDTWYQ